MEAIQGKSPNYQRLTMTWARSRSRHRPCPSHFYLKICKTLASITQAIKRHLSILFGIRHLHPSVSFLSPPFSPSSPSSLHHRLHHRSHPFVFIRGSQYSSSDLKSFVPSFLSPHLQQQGQTHPGVRLKMQKCWRKSRGSERDHIIYAQRLGSSALTFTQQLLVYPSASILGWLK